MSELTNTHRCTTILYWRAHDNFDNSIEQYTEALLQVLRQSTTTGTCTTNTVITTIVNCTVLILLLYLRQFLNFILISNQSHDNQI